MSGKSLRQSLLSQSIGLIGVLLLGLLATQFYAYSSIVPVMETLPSAKERDNRTILQDSSLFRKK